MHDGRVSGAKQRPKPFLLKMVVVGEHVGQPFPAHGLHGNAIGEAVALVGTSGVKIEARQKRLMALRDDTHGIVRKDLPHGLHGVVSKPAITRKKCEDLGQNLFGRINDALRKKSIKMHGRLRVPIARICQRNPVKRIGKNRLH